MWYKVRGHDLTTEELKACFGVRSFNKKSKTYYLYSTEGRMLKKEAWGDHLTSIWFFLGGPWESPMHGATPVTRHVPFVFYIPNWPSNCTKAFLVTSRVVEYAFSLKKKP